MGGYYYEYMWLHIPSDHTNAVGDSTEYIQEGFMVLLETNDPRTQSPEAVFNEINNKILSGEAIEMPIPDHHIYSKTNPDWITAVVNDFGTEINGPDNSWETMNKSFGDELLFDWAHEDVEITDNLDGWYTVEFVGEGIDAGKTVQFTDIEKLIFSAGSDAPLEMQVVDGPVVGSADWFESGGSWLGAAADQTISYDENNVEFRIEGDTVKVYADVIETVMEMQTVTETYKDSRGRTKTRTVEKEVAVEHTQEGVLIWEGGHDSFSGLQFADGQNVNVISVREFDIGGNLIEMTLGTDTIDLIFGSEGDNVIFGAGGDDIIVGGGGNDIILGGMGEDAILGGEGDDLLLGDIDEDVLRDEFNLSEEQIAAILANKQLDDGSSNDLIIGGEGIDHVDGGDGNNVVISGGVDNLDINQDGEANIQDIEELVGKDIFEDDSWA